jgi:hypothetical protein
MLDLFSQGLLRTERHVPGRSTVRYTDTVPVNNIYFKVAREFVSWLKVIMEARQKDMMIPHAYNSLQNV